MTPFNAEAKATILLNAIFTGHYELANGVDIDIVIRHLFEAYRAGQESTYLISCKTPNDILVFRDRDAYKKFMDKIHPNACHQHEVIFSEGEVYFKAKQLEDK